MKKRVIKSRLPVIKKYCKNKVVLDIGCVAHKADKEKNTYWLHKQIRKVAKKIVGIDIQEEEVKKLVKKGYDIRVGNAEEIGLKNRNFEVVVAGEFIEHISNKGKFLENMYNHLSKEGVLILTTPSLFALRYQIRNLFSGKIVPNKEHVCWFDFYTLKNLCERHGFLLKKSYYHFNTDTPWYKYFPVRMATFLRKNYAPRILFVLEKKRLE